MSMGKNRELMGANTQPVSVVGSGARTVVRLDPKVRGKVAASLASASETQFPDHVYLNLENVRGVRDAHVLSVYINLPEGGRPGDHPELLAGSVALFGLRRASRKDGEHAGQGLSFTLDITDIVDALHLGKQLNADSLHVTIVPNRAVPEQAEITIGRVSVYRQGQ